MTSPDCPYVMHGSTVREPEPTNDTRDENEARIQDLEALVAELRRRVEAMTAEANAAALRYDMRERYHEAQIAGWREACIDHGVQPDAGSLRVHLDIVLYTVRSIDRLLRMFGREVAR